MGADWRSRTRSTLRLVIPPVAAVLAACGGSTPTAPPTPAPTATPQFDAISIVSIQPAAGTTLSRGQTASFVATLQYTLVSAPTGQVALVIQDENVKSLQPAGSQPAILAVRGSGTVTLTDSVTVPASGSAEVHVFFPLVPAGTTTTNVVANAVYPVR